jgi:hypothetical protein
MAGFSLTQEERVALTFIAHNDPRDGFVRRTWLEFKAAICGLLQRTRVNGWIPVSERLPEELTTVLVYHPDAPFAPSGIDLASQMDGDSWMLSDGRLGQPTHWMPLPEPPKN